MVVGRVGAGTAAQAFALPTLLVANVVGERLAMFLKTRVAKRA